MRYVPDRLDHACAIGHRDAAILGRHAARDDAIIMIVEGCRVEPHPDHSATRGTGVGPFDQLQPIQSTRCIEDHRLHTVAFIAVVRSQKTQARRDAIPQPVASTHPSGRKSTDI